MSTEKFFNKFCNNREKRNGLVAREPVGGYREAKDFAFSP